METLFVTRQVKIRQKDNTICLEADFGKRSVPAEHLSHVVLLGEADLNTRLLSFCGKHGIRVSVFDYYGNFKGTFEPVSRSPSGKVKVLQGVAAADPENRMRIAREIVRGAMNNMCANLDRHRYRRKSDTGDLSRKIRSLAGKLGSAGTVEELMGYEGNAHQWYYDAWSRIHPSLDFAPRVRRPPNNPVNCLISFLNQLTYSVVAHETSKTHLDNSIGFLHSPSSGRRSLSLDLSEPFKPLIVDRIIFSLFLRGTDMDGWLDQKKGVCLLTELGRKQVVEHFAARLEEDFHGVPVRKLIYREALSLERDLLGIDEYQAFCYMA